MQADERAAAVRAGGAAVSRVARTAGETHAAILRMVGIGLRPLGPAGGIPVGATGLIAQANYRAVAAVAQAAGAIGGPVAARTAAPDAPPVADQPGAVPWLAALGGAFGDHLVGDPDLRPLAVPMALRSGAAARGPAEFADHAPTGTLVLFVHGLCSHESMWAAGYADTARRHGGSPVAVRYTTGQPVEDSAAELATLLDSVVVAWPVLLERIVLVGHSMGGLVLRAALARGGAWRGLVTDAVTLGTPHAGAPLERAARAMLALAARHPVTAPVGSLGDERSAGIKDLALGSRAEAAPDVAWHLVAGVAPGPAPSRLGDGLVTLDSAFDVPADRVARRLRIDGADHLALLDHPEVADLLGAVVGAT